jgi:hypothetical protein
MTLEKITTNHLLGYTLFLGIEVTPSLEGEFSKMNPALLQLFSGPDYLKKIKWEGKDYLGKDLSPNIEISALENARDNVLSLLRRLVPKFIFSADDLILFGSKEF